MKKFLAILVMLCLFSGIVSAEDYFLESRYERINCNAQFSIQNATDLADVNSVNAGVLNEKINSLNSVLTELQAQTENKQMFNQKSVNAWAQIQGLNAEIRQQLRTVRGPSGSAFRAELRTKYSTGRTEYVECKKNSRVSFAEARIQKYRDTINRWSAKMVKLEAKGVNTAGMQKIIDEANTVIMAPLEAALVSSDSNALTEALKQYCLYNGCESGLNYNFSIKIQLAQYEAVFDTFKTVAIEAGYDDEVEEIESSIDNIKGYIDDVLGYEMVSQELEIMIAKEFEDIGQALWEITNGLSAEKYEQAKAEAQTTTEGDAE